MNATPAELTQPPVMADSSSPSPSNPPEPTATPTPSPPAGGWWRTLLACSLAVGIASAGTMLVSDYWKGSLKVPLQYDGDALLYLPLVKAVHETGTHWTNPRMGAPDGFVLHDFPIPDSLHFFTLWVLCAASGDYATGYNLFVLSQFPLAALTATWVARRFSAGVLTSVMCGVLFAYLPHHVVVYTNHIFLSAYYPVPLAIWLVVRVYLGRLTLLRRHPVINRLRPPYLSADGMVALLVCALLATTGAYFAMFTAGLLVVAALARLLDVRRLTAAVPGVLLAGLIVAGLAVNLAPSLLYQKQHGSNPLLKRSAAESNTWALRPAELFVPPPFHRSERLSKVGADYAASFGQTIVVDVASFTYLGFVPAAGVVLALALGLRRRPAADPVLPVLTRLLVALLLVAVVGGFGPLFNHFVSPWIRCYHRVSVFVGCCGTLALTLAVGRLATSPRRWVRLMPPVGAVLLLAVGLYDQTYPKLVRPYEARSHVFRADREFVRGVEQALPEGAAVFQLPYVPYPEAGHVGEIDNYTPCIGYLHSDKLRWGYGASKGRALADWCEGAAALPPEQMVPLVLTRGYTAVWVDRWGYPGRTPPVEPGLAALADGPPLVSGNGRYAVYTFAKYHAGWRARLAAGERPVLAVLPSWGVFAFEETIPVGPMKRFRWSEKDGTVTLYNPADYPQKVRLRWGMKTYTPGKWRITVDGVGVSDDLSVTEVIVPYEREVTVPPGSHAVRFHCDAPPFKTSYRTVVFLLADYSFTTIPEGGGK